MALTQPITGQDADSDFFSDSVTYNVPNGTPILSPIPGNVVVNTDKTITVKSPEGSSVKFENVGIPSVTNGSSVRMGSQLGYTSDKKLSFTVFDKSGKKKNAEKFLSDTDVSTLLVGGGSVLSTTSNSTDSTINQSKETIQNYLGIKPEIPTKKAEDFAGFRMATGVGLAPFYLTDKAFGLDNQKEGITKKENLIKEEILRIKKLMK